MKKDFFEVLKEKVHQDVSPSSDAAFWKKFQVRFEEIKPPQPSYSLGFRRLKWFMPVGAAALLVISLVIFQNRQQEIQIADIDARKIGDIFEEREIIEQLDFLESFDEVASYSEEEWKIILGDEEG